MKLSIQEITYLRNPDKFNRAYQYVLKHRIMNKKKQAEDLLSLIDRHKRVFMPEKERELYDEDERIKENIREYHKSLPRIEFIPNFAERIRKFDKAVLTVERHIMAFEIVFASDQFKEKYTSLTDKEKKVLSRFLLYMQKRLKRCYERINGFSEQSSSMNRKRISP